MTLELAPMSPTTAFRYDPSTLEFQSDIWDVYRVLRDEHPVFHDVEKDQYVLSRFDDVWRAVHDSTRSRASSPKPTTCCRR